MNFKHASFGTVSHGTLRTDDLLDSFASELEWQVRRNRAYYGSPEGPRDDAMVRLIAEARNAEGNGLNEDDCAEIVQELIDALQEFAPAYAYFGAHCGNGSDFGYWIDNDALDHFDGLRVSDTSEIPDNYSGEVLHVNDHGNMTLYAANNGALVEVWGVV